MTEQAYTDRINYDPTTGNFSWRVSAPGISAGKSAGYVSLFGYRVICVNRKAIRAGRLAWFLFYGKWPDGEIDHINNNRLDDRISNLRVVDRSGNSQNRRSAMANNKSCGLLGATWNKQHKRWQAKIVASKIRYHLGYFDTPEDAHAAYMKAKDRLHIHGGSH